jgi:hypothetical protein
MTDTELDTCYTALCETLAQQGEAQATAYLARFALLAMVEVDQPSTLLRLIEQAKLGDSVL